jgi:starch-binding outer membrane protein, SusD/RagB family
MNLHRSLARGLAAGAALLGLAACSDLTNLDETAQTFISPDKFYQNDAQAAIAVNGVYAPLMGWNGWKSPAQYGVLCEDNEVLCWNWMGGGFAGKSAGEWYMQDNSVWFGDYQIIQRANDVIANVANAAGITEGMKKTATGQALFARGYAYFDLARRYGGVPLRLEPYKPEAQLGAMARGTVDQVYLQVAKDLRAATGMLPAAYAQPNGQGLPRVASAWGLLAKVYLHMAGDELTGTPLAGAKAAYVDSARLAAQQEMADASVRLEASYMDLFDVQKQNTSPEILFAVQGATTGLNGSQIPAFFGPRGDCTLVGGCGQGFASLREDFVRSFEAGDKRAEPNKAIARTWEVTNSPLGKIRAIQADSITILRDKGLLVRDQAFRWENWMEGCGAFQHQYDSLTVKNAATGATSTQVVAVARPFYTLKYIDPAHLGSDQAAANNFLILRHADVLLIFAEAENEKNGPTAAAYAAINAVRQRAGLAPLAGLSQSAFRQAVWAERSHELYAEFQARHDLIRQGRWLQVMAQPSSVSDFAGHGACRTRQTFQRLQPIPNKEISANPLITQNPGY